MTAYLLTEWFGTFRLENGRVAAQSLFPRDAKAMAARLKAMQDGGILPEEQELASQGPVLVVEERLLRIPGARLAREGVPQAPRPQDYNFTLQTLHDAAVELGRLNVRTASGGRDRHIVMAVETIDDLLEASNLLTERLREWYGLHAPELLSRVDRPEELAGLISAHVTREGIAAARPDLAPLLEDSMGAPLSEADQIAIRAFARSVSTLFSSRAEIEKYLDNAMPRVAPNVTALLGATLAARFIRTAGGLERLARMSAGTIQTLGAEKALFRHIKEGKKPPKHGLLFQHLSLHRAPRHQRGALARALAAKTAIAARADAFTHNDITAELLADWNQREAGIRREHATARTGRERPTHPGGRPFRAPDRGGRPAYGGGGPPQRGPPRGDRPGYGDRQERPAYGGGRPERPAYGDRPRYGDRQERPAYGQGRPERPGYGGDRQDRPAYGDRRPGGFQPDRRGPPPPPRGDRPAYGDRPSGGGGGYRGGDRPSYGGGPSGGGGGYRGGDRPPRDNRPPRDDRPPSGGGYRGGDRPQGGGDRPPYGKKKRFGGDRQ